MRELTDSSLAGQFQLNHELILVAHSARPFDLDGVIVDFVRFNDHRKDDFGLQTCWQQCQTLDSYNVPVALLQCECVTRELVQVRLVTLQDQCSNEKF